MTVTMYCTKCEADRTVPGARLHAELDAWQRHAQGARHQAYGVIIRADDPTSPRA